MTTINSPVYAAIIASRTGLVRVKTAAHITGDDAEAGIARLARLNECGDIIVAWDSGVVTEAAPTDIVLE
jgi:hypothetical protein